MERETGGEVSGSIQRIAADDVRLICSGQVIVDLSTAVKELVENAIDRIAG